MANDDSDVCAEIITAILEWFFALPLIHQVLCSSSCLFITFGIVGFYYYEKSFLDIHHECEIYHYYMSLCRYACGTECDRRRLIKLNNDTKTEELSSHSHCHTKYCWGMRWIYQWRTLDWEYHPYGVQVNIAENILTNITERKIHKLNVLRDYINNNSIILSEDQINEINITEYVLFYDNVEEYLNSLIFMSFTSTSLENMSTTLNPYDVNWCDWKRPAYTTIGVCSAFPIRWRDMGDMETCWTNNKCSWFVEWAPATNWAIAKGFGITSSLCGGILFISLMYLIFKWLYYQVFEYVEYQYIPSEPTDKFNDKTYDSVNAADSYTFQ
eukprot:257204_1